MSTETVTDGKAQLAEAISKLLKGERDPKDVQAACERMDRMREETRARVGTVEIAVDLICELRDE
ncbi:hypothetical protein AYO47_08160 [Planctomyces sp. SCGC AG-212-M04]|nr:hypothetical protein AYO47_08160 [Planctomyces sp. SCGC AG-212-M04]